ncbi:hypothetical protein BCV69DRAFT_299266 [Microstroma glucosiphilum]|uniref:Uncharacterized protein n=1 Tax=Pseudomicrostroma glucosiphilum TaxID=1684307 RepID=A0A316U6F4_9BASI|nr:hypothetical protein BCV69DRAFT_299266 [Pseudomicrostroma glucosiphilum]PWN20790.1 hypothetical protein BCV69DRAFT_299266 [Pseudomicrostroma glucosiphilum]
MSALLSLFSCCVPGRRSPASSSENADSERTPLLRSSPSRSPNQSASHLSDSKGGPSAIAGAGAPSSPANQGDDPAGAAGAASKPAYTTEDLASITGWARAKFIPLKQPNVLSERTVDEKGKSRGALLEEVEMDKAELASVGQPDDQLKSLIEKLAKGLAFDGWTGQETDDKERDRDARSESGSEAGK